MFNLVPRALFPGFGGGAGKMPGKSALGMKLIKCYVNFIYICSAVLSVISILYLMSSGENIKYKYKSCYQGKY